MSKFMRVYNVIVVREGEVKKDEVPITSSIFTNLEEAQADFEDWWNHLVSNENVIEEKMEGFDKGHAYVKIDNDGEIVHLYLGEQIIEFAEG